MTQDIVIQQAWKVVKDDFIENLKHEEENIYEALGAVSGKEINQKMEQMGDLFVKNVQETGKFSESIEFCAKQASSMLEFVIFMRTMVMFLEKIKETRKGFTEFLDRFLK